MIARLLREPLLHFLLLGLGLFLYYGRVAAPGDDGHVIVVSPSQVVDLARQYEAIWNRPPTRDEMAALVETKIRDEILYREGKTLGLERDDPVIKRRVRQKLEVMLEEDGSRRAPADADLAAYLSAHAEAFQTPASISFEQVVFTADRPADAAMERARQQLQSGADPATVGQPTLLPARVEDAALDRVTQDFGERFSAQLAALPIGRWSGPVESTFGLHLVRVTRLRPATLPSLDEVRATVAREWEHDQRTQALDASYKQLREAYSVRIEDGTTAPSRP